MKNAASNWSKPAKIALLLATLWPFLYMLLFFGFFFTSIAYQGDEVEGRFFFVFALHLATMLEMGVLLVVYMVDLFKTTRIRQDTKALWAVVLFMGNMIAMPIYWYLNIWRDPAPELPSFGSTDKS